MTKVSGVMTNEEAEEIVRAADKDKNGVIDYEGGSKITQQTQSFILRIYDFHNMQQHLRHVNALYASSFWSHVQWVSLSG